MLISADEILRAAMDICEIASAAAGDENFLADAIGALKDGNATSAFAGFGCAEKSRCAGAEDESVKFVS